MIINYSLFPIFVAVYTWLIANEESHFSNSEVYQVLVQGFVGDRYLVSTMIVHKVNYKQFILLA